MRTTLMNHAKRGLLTHMVGKPFEFMKDIKTITFGLSYTRRSQPHRSKSIDLTWDVDKAKDAVTNLFNRGEIDVAEYKYKIIWLNEMGEEQVAYSEDESDRNARMQALADDGYSPVWREV